LKNARTKNILLLCLAFAASALMLTVIQAPLGVVGISLNIFGWCIKPELNWLAWVSLVPFILACCPAVKPRPLALAAYLVSLCYWLGNLYWVFPITVVGWVVFCLYTALLAPILALCLRFCRIKKIPLFLAAGVLFVGAERLQGFFLGGFFWRFLAHSQYANITLIQTADIFGTAGLSFLIAMVNGLLAELIIAARLKNIFKISNLIKTSLVCAALVAAVFYGRWRINESDKFITQGPLVASLQSNIPQSVKRSFQESGRIFDELMRDSKASAEAGAELIVWPETMVQAILNTRVWPFLISSETEENFDKALSEHSKDTAFVLVGAYGGQIRQQSDSTIYLARYNSAFLYNRDGQQDQKHYDKIHLVPFGEAVPFRRRLPSLYNLLMKFTPYNYDYSLDAGSEYTVFEMTSPVRNSTTGKTAVQKGKISNGAGGEGKTRRVYKFSVMICYEATVPAIARRFAIDSPHVLLSQDSNGGKKRLDWLINISNDGWFVRFDNGKISPSTELPQHAAICVFRAVENRLAVLRSVNTGISCLIDTLGRVRNGFTAGSLPHKAMARKGMAGWFVDRVPIDKRTTFFSKYGQWLDFCCAACLVLLIIVPPLAKFLLRKS